MTPEVALAQVRERHGITLTFEGPCPGGDVGAFYARGDDGGRFVFKWLDHRENDRVDHRALTEMVARLSGLRSRGYPLPHHWPPLEVPDGVVIVQEAVAGRWDDEVSESLVDTVLRLNDLQAGNALESASWTDYVRMTLLEGADGYCLHDSLRAHGGVTRRVLAWIESVGRAIGPLPGADLVHLDFHHRNLLRDEDHLVAVIDWEGSRPGDRVFDLVTFCFGFTHARATGPELERRVWERASTLAGRDALAAYVAHMSLRRLDWSIRFHPDEVDGLIGLVDRYMALVD